MRLSTACGGVQGHRAGAIGVVLAATHCRPVDVPRGTHYGVAVASRVPSVQSVPLPDPGPGSPASPASPSAGVDETVPPVHGIPELATERLRLRPYSRRDAAAVQALLGDGRMADTTMGIPHPYPEGAAQRWIAGHAAAAV